MLTWGGGLSGGSPKPNRAGSRRAHRGVELTCQRVALFGGLATYEEKKAMGLKTRASTEIKVLGVGASLGACAPLVVITILLQRDVRRRTARLARLAAASLEPHVDSMRREL